LRYVVLIGDSFTFFFKKQEKENLDVGLEQGFLKDYLDDISF
jgi:hypothetical protein